LYLSFRASQVYNIQGVLKDAQGREARGRRTSRASSKTEVLHTTIITTDRPGIEFRASGITVEGDEHTGPTKN